MGLQDKNRLLGADNYYETTIAREAVPAPLQDNLHADALVIGGGLAGLSAAIELAQRGMQVVVLEAQRVCEGPSGRNGGQVIAGVACGQSVYEQQFGMDTAKQVWDLSLQAVQLVKQRIAQFEIDCDPVWSYMTAADSPRKQRALAAEVAHMRQHYGVDMPWYSGESLKQHINSPRFLAAAGDPYSGHINPLRYGLGLARAARQLGVRIFEQSAVTGLTQPLSGSEHWRAQTAQGSVTAPWGVLAGNCALAWEGPQVAPQLHSRVMPVGTYIIATEPVSPALCEQLLPTNAAVCDNNFILDYFRFSGDHRMLFGGRVSYTTGMPRDLPERMRQRMVQTFPALRDVQIAHCWGGFVDISMNRAPDFGRLAPNLFYLQGFSGHGLALTGLAGQLVAEALHGTAARFDLLAQMPHRAFPGGTALRMPLLVLGTLYHRLKDSL